MEIGETMFSSHDAKPSRDQHGVPSDPLDVYIVTHILKKPRHSTISKALPVQVLDDVSYFISFPKYGGGEIFKVSPHLQSHVGQHLYPSFVAFL